jgi:hypothetical protein
MFLLLVIIVGWHRGKYFKNKSEQRGFFAISNQSGNIAKGGKR